MKIELLYRSSKLNFPEEKKLIFNLFNLQEEALTYMM